MNLYYVLNTSGPGDATKGLRARLRVAVSTGAQLGTAFRPLIAARDTHKGAATLFKPYYRRARRQGPRFHGAARAR